MSDFTPGPWEIEDSEDGLQTSVCGDIKVRFNRDNSKMAAEAWANARLIAAAPELLEALREFVSAVEFVDPGVYSDQIADAKKAISKATGGQNE